MFVGGEVSPHRYGMEFRDLRYRFRFELENWPPTTETFDHYLANFLLQHGESSRLTAGQKLELREAFGEAILLRRPRRRVS